MFIHSIKLTNYKSIGDYDKNELIVEPKVTAIIGKNESGKSNVLEGISKIGLLSKKENAFIMDCVNRYAPDDASNSFLITLKHSGEEIDKGAKTLTQIRITKDAYEATGGIVDFYNNTVKNSLEELAEFLKSIGNNPFRLSGQSLTDYTAYLNEIQKEDHLNFYRIASLIKECEGHENYISQNKRQEYNQILEKCKDEWKVFSSHFPAFFYRQSNKVLNYSYQYDEINNELNNVNANPNSLLREFVKIIKIKKEAFIEACKPGSNGPQLVKRDRIRSAIKREINAKFQSFYKTEPLNLDIEFNAGRITFNIKKNEGTPLLLSERSNGLKWYLNLFIDMLAQDVVNKNVVFLLDEPGINLHVNAQRELLRFFAHLADNGNQVIYTTHSPYMLDTENDGIHRIRAVVKNEDENTYIYKTAYDPHIAPDSQNDTMAPIVSALGMSMKDTFGPAKDKLNVITEGISDYIYINLMSQQLNVDLSKVYFIPAQGATNCVNIAKILHGWGCKYIALFDYDKEGVEKGGEQIRKTFDTNMGENYQYVVDVKQQDIDNRTYSRSPKAIEDLMIRGEIDRFCTVANVRGDKSLIAKLLSNAVEKQTFVLSQETKQNFVDLFKRLNIVV